jgi:hypothetical protein
MMVGYERREVEEAEARVAEKRCIEGVTDDASTRTTCSLPTQREVTRHN